MSEAITVFSNEFLDFEFVHELIEFGLIHAGQVTGGMRFDAKLRALLS